MTTISSLYRRCGDLFAQYPLAIRRPHCSGHIRSMILVLEDDGTARFYVLSHNESERGPIYSLFDWPAGRISDIDEEIRTGRALDKVDRVLTGGVPVPLHGSLFGWRRDDSITALIAIYAKYSPAHKEPSWTVMPLTDIPETQWPPFTGMRFFGDWFWQWYRAGNIASLSRLIASTPDTVFWVDTQMTLGSGSCAVAAEVSSQEGYRLRRGCYMYYRALQAGIPAPSLGALLSEDSRIDLSLGFR
jgi:hypothetical protein